MLSKGQSHDKDLASSSLFQRSKEDIAASVNDLMDNYGRQESFTAVESDVELNRLHGLHHLNASDEELATLLS